MSLEQQMQEQYKKRENKAHLYDHSAYVSAVQAELQTALQHALKSYFKDLSKLSILEVGAGHGGNARLLVNAGVDLKNITFNELLKDRLTILRQNYPNNTIYAGDAIRIPIDRTFDVVFQSTVFTSILSDQARKDLAQRMWDLLKSGGVILWYDFIYNNPNNNDVRKVTVEELRALFPKAKTMEVSKITLAPPIGRRVGKLYPIFNLPILRTHILAVLQKV